MCLVARTDVRVCQMYYFRIVYANSHVMCLIVGIECDVVDRLAAQFLPRTTQPAWSNASRQFWPKNTTKHWLSADITPLQVILYNWITAGGRSVEILITYLIIIPGSVGVVSERMGRVHGGRAVQIPRGESKDACREATPPATA